MLDNIKLAIAVLLLGAGIGAFYYFGKESELLRILGLLAVAGISLALAYQTALGRRMGAVIVDARGEIRKVVWPTRKETAQTTLMVVLMVLVVGVLLWILDMSLLSAVRYLTERGS
jgi:preprotein translocase subunit SecE